MILRISAALDAPTLSTLQELAGEALFEEGGKTAGWSARAVKKNQQIAAGPVLQTMSRMVEDALRRSALFMAVAQPKAFCRIAFNRYVAGMGYGTHVDDALIGGLRTDLSFTLFLSAPDDYAGGELVLEGAEGETVIKLAAGDLVLYPSDRLHRVEEVREGARLACIGWVRSLVRLECHREILFDLETAARGVYEREGKSALFDQLSKVRTNLTRLWADD